jgi:hypothetical protein
MYCADERFDLYLRCMSSPLAHAAGLASGIASGWRRTAVEIIRARDVEATERKAGSMLPAR